MSNQAITFYKEYLINFDHILYGSYALKLHDSAFRHSNDVDLYFPNVSFVWNLLSGQPDHSKYYELLVGCEEYTGDLLGFQIKFKDNSHIDTYSKASTFDLINDIKIAKLDNILKAKKQIIWSEIAAPNPDIVKIKKHVADLQFFNAL